MRPCSKCDGKGGFDRVAGVHVACTRCGVRGPVAVAEPTAEPKPLPRLHYVGDVVVGVVSDCTCPGEPRRLSEAATITPDREHESHDVVPPRFAEDMPVGVNFEDYKRWCRMFAEAPAVLAERDGLKRFKDYVHKRLDGAGVPADPESPHKAKGCRIGGRLDHVFDLIEELTVHRDLLRAACRDAIQTLGMDTVQEQLGVGECIDRIEAALANLPEN